MRQARTRRPRARHPRCPRGRRARPLIPAKKAHRHLQRFQHNFQLRDRRVLRRRGRRRGRVARAVLMIYWVRRRRGRGGR